MSSMTTKKTTMSKSSTEPGNKSSKQTCKPKSNQNQFQHLDNDHSDSEDALNTSNSTAFSVEDSEKPKIYSRSEFQKLIDEMTSKQGNIVLPPNLLRITKITRVLKVKISRNVPRPQPQPSPKPQKFRGDIKYDEEQTIKRSLKLSLNILAVENYNKLKDEILANTAKTPGLCKSSVEQIVHLAWEQSKYRNLYAKLCCFLVNSNLIPQESGKNCFRQYLFHAVQVAFEEIGKKIEANSDEESAQLREKAHRKALGNICFISELYLEKVFSAFWMRLITGGLLVQFIKNYTTYNPSSIKPKFLIHEDILEALIKLYEVIGKKYEEDSKAKVDSKSADELVKFFETALRKKDTDISKLESGLLTQAHVFQIFNIILSKCTLTPRLDSLIKNLNTKREEKFGDSIPKPIVFVETTTPTAKKTTLPRKGFANPKEITFQVLNSLKEEDSDDGAMLEKLKDIKPVTTSFFPQRGNKGKEESKVQEVIPKSTRISDASEKFKELYKDLEENTLESAADLVKTRFVEMKQAFSGLELAFGFFRSFYDGRKNIVILNRVPLAKYLLVNSLITLQEFETGFKESLLLVDSEDFPLAPQFFATVLFNYLETNKKVKLVELVKLDKKGGKEFEGMELLEKFLSNLRKLAETSGDSKEIVSEIERLIETLGL